LYIDNVAGRSSYEEGFLSGCHSKILFILVFMTLSLARESYYIGCTEYGGRVLVSLYHFMKFMKSEK
jgi:hypothetical protein